MTQRPPGLRRRRRVALYSHDTQGLGHTRRNLLIAAALVEADPATDVLVLTGAPEATVLPLPPSTDVLTLPTLRKHPDGRYSPRALGMPMDDLLRTRAHMIDSVLTSFDPDLVIVDKVPRGVHGDLDLGLTSLRHLGHARMVLGLRDVLDTPAVARGEWEQQRTTQAVRDYYDAVWVYGDPSVYDLVREYALPAEVAEKVTFTGYLAGPRPSCMRPRCPTSMRAALAGAPYVVCLVGGGQDGSALVQAFVRASLPRGHQGIVLTGPYMPAAQRESVLAQVRGRGDLTVLEFATETDDLLAGASAAVTMGGYNSLCELLRAGCPSLVVPRVVPRLEQALRAQRLAQAGLVDVLLPDVMSAERIGRWLSQAVRRRPVRTTALDIDGLARIPPLAEQMLGAVRLPEEFHVRV